ncbi:MAG: hypothetical protein KF685_09860 [Acidobacteria bacterium]|nr:hypothetical protein [Acidobacteriota bacterium]
MGDQERFDEAYEGNNYALLVLETDGESMKLKLKVKKVPGLGESGTIWAARKNGKWVLDFGLGDEEYDEDELPNPIKKLIATKGGGPNGNPVTMPKRSVIITMDNMIRPYEEYRKRFTSARIFDLRIHDILIPESLYYQVALLYLQMPKSPQRY